MKRLLKFNWLLILIFVLTTATAQEAKEKIVYKLNIKHDITKATWRHTQQAFEEADSLNADVFLMSSNAVTLDGCLYNVDGTGNRIAALIYGPAKVYVLAGTNKLVANLEEAEQRIRMIAAPANCVRLNKENPCTITGTCMNCSRPSTICNQYLVSRRSGKPGRIHVILINENLGY